MHNDTYDGTIFRFPLRQSGETSELLETEKPPTYADTVAAFDSLENEARLCLLFLRNIESVEFKIRHEPLARWRVERGRWPREGSFADLAEIELRTSSNPGKSSTDQWWLVMADIDDAPSDAAGSQK